MTCEHAFARDLPPTVMIAKPFATRRGQMIVAPICDACVARGQETIVADVLARLRVSGMPDARPIGVGSA
jgi:hypothetical protein